jgi:hypothetical protein
MPIFSEIEEGRTDKKYNSPEIDDMNYHITWNSTKFTYSLMMIQNKFLGAELITLGSY